MQNPVFYGAFLAISWIKPRSVVTNYSECMRSNSAYRDAYVTRSQTQSVGAFAVTDIVRYNYEWASYIIMATGSAVCAC